MPALPAAGEYPPVLKEYLPGLPKYLSVLGEYRVSEGGILISARGVPGSAWGTLGSPPLGTDQLPLSDGSDLSLNVHPYRGASLVTVADTPQGNPNESLLIHPLPECGCHL